MKLNTLFVERLNLAIRQGSAYLLRRTIRLVRWKGRLEDHFEILRCYCSFVRLHRALKFGRETRTPALQAGLSKRRLTLREIFSSRLVYVVSDKIVIMFVYSTISVVADDKQMPLAA